MLLSQAGLHGDDLDYMGITHPLQRRALLQAAPGLFSPVLQVCLRVVRSAYHAPPPAFCDSRSLPGLPRHPQVEVPAVRDLGRGMLLFRVVTHWRVGRRAGTTTPDLLACWPGLTHAVCL